MKLTLMLPMLAVLAYEGCDVPSPSLLSLEAVTTDQDNTIDATLVGTWETDKSSDEFCVIRRDGDTGYHIVYVGGTAPSGFAAKLFRAGEGRFLEVVATSGDDFLIPGHAVARIWTEGGGLKWAFLDSDWFKQQAAQLPNRVDDKRMLLLAPGPAVRALIAKYGADDRAYGKVVTWQRSQ